MVLPETGKGLPKRESRVPIDYADAIAAALRTEFDGRRHMIKVIMKWTGASGRTVRYWMSGEAEPNARHLIAMMGRSDYVLETVLAVSRRTDLLRAFYELKRMPEKTQVQGAHASGAGSAPKAGQTAPVSVPDGPGRVPDGPDQDGETWTGALGPNERQLWFVAELERDPRICAANLAKRFGVSLRTAKRDIAVLKASAKLTFIGNRRRGRYSAFGTGSTMPASIVEAPSLTESPRIPARNGQRRSAPISRSQSASERPGSETDAT